MSILVLDQERTYHLRLPRGYNPDKAYPLIFRWHGRGGNGLDKLGIASSAGEDAIVVGADGLNKDWNRRTFTADLEFFDRMLESFERRYCIDRSRIFSYGFSAGAYFSAGLACERGEILRAFAAIAGGPRGGSCKGKVATWLVHDVGDAVVPMTQGWAALAQALASNGCSTNTVDEGGGCVRYLGCGTAPVVWCASNGWGHNIRADLAPSIWRFFVELR